MFLVPLLRFELRELLLLREMTLPICLQGYKWCLWGDSNPHTPPYLDGAMPRYKLGSLTG